MLKELRNKKRNKIICLSFPRSGHHLLVNLLLKYFSNNLNYMNLLDHKASVQCNEVLKAGDFYYCEFYAHCRKSYCIDPRTNFQKNHDLDLTLRNNPKFNYIIQYRTPLETLVSLYLFNVKKGLKDSEKKWKEFANKNILLWKAWIDKWILKNKNPNTFYLKYNDLVNKPQDNLKKVIELTKLEQKPNLKLIKRAIEKEKVSFRRDIRKFKYFDPTFFKKLEKKVERELKELRLNTYFIN